MTARWNRNFSLGLAAVLAVMAPAIGGAGGKRAAIVGVLLVLAAWDQHRKVDR